MLRSALLAIAGVVFIAGAAHARDLTATAKLESAAASKIRIVADSAVWVCEGSACVAVLQQSPSLKGCKMLVRKAGTVSSYGTEALPLSPENLAACNAEAPKPSLQAAR